MDSPSSTSSSSDSFSGFDGFDMIVAFGVPIGCLFLVSFYCMYYHILHAIKNLHHEVDAVKTTIDDLHETILYLTEEFRRATSYRADPHDPFRTEFAQHQGRVHAFHQQTQAPLAPAPHTYAAQPEFYRYATTPYAHNGAPATQGEPHQQTNASSATMP